MQQPAPAPGEWSLSPSSDLTPLHILALNGAPPAELEQFLREGDATAADAAA